MITINITETGAAGTLRMEVSRDGMITVRQVASADLCPDRPLPDGYVWGRRDGRWVPVLDVRTLSS